MLRIFKYLKKGDIPFILGSVAFIVLQVWLELRLPDYMSEITRLVQTEGSAMSAILTAGLKMMLCALGGLVASVSTAVIAARLATGFSANLRERMFDKVQSFSHGEIGRFSTASLITRTTNDITQVMMLIVFGMQSVIRAPIMAALALGKISTKSAAWTFTTGAAVVMLMVIVITAMSLAMPKFKRLQMLTDDLNRVTRENLNGIRVVRAYNAEDYQEKKFSGVNDELTRTHLFTGRVMAFMQPSIQLVMSGLTLAIYWLGAALIQSADMTEKITLFSDMIVFTQYAMQVVMAFMMLVMIFIMMPRAAVSSKRILEVLDTPVSIRDGAVTEGDSGKKGEVEFKDVCFRYPDSDENMLEGITFSAHRGETVALIGSTGSGKSTLINLIPRFYDVSEGSVTVDGVDVRDYTQKALRDKIGFVAQKAVLFSGTIKGNITFGAEKTISYDDVVKAVHTAQASDFVETDQVGYDGYVAQGGGNLSGGQKQRLSIARAIARHPEILIFDDSFSALDYKTDRTLRRQLEADCADSTKIIVAQRIGTIRDADRIIVLDEGRIAGIGTHSQLMADCEVYRQIAYSQLSKEELA